MRQVEITQKSDGAWTFSVGGEDIAESVKGVRIVIEEAGKPAHITLRLVDITRFTGMADVVIDPVLHSVLTKLGWTPPITKEP